MNEGKRFETNIKNSISDDVYYMRIKDSPSSFGEKSSNLRFTLDNPYDMFLFWNSVLFPFELKSTKQSSFSIQRQKEKNGQIKLHQIEGLLNACKYNGIIPGFLFDFREKTENTYFLHIKDFCNFLADSNKQSINEQDIINYGGILILKEKKRVNYKYDIFDLLNKLKSIFQ